MNALLAIFIFGCLIFGIVVVGLVMAMSLVSPDDPRAFEGRAADESDE